MRNTVLVFFVPVEATQREFETALRGQLASLHSDKTAQEAKSDRVEITDSDQWPLWTWFVPNPWP